jgi:hypothetical protein
VGEDQSLKFLPERFFNDSSSRYIAKRNNPIPAESFKIRRKIFIVEPLARLLTRRTVFFDFKQ